MFSFWGLWTKESLLSFMPQLPLLDLINIIKDYITMPNLSNGSKQVLFFSLQLTFKFLGHQIESEIASLMQETPQLVKLGITLQFRETLNKTATQLQRNLDQSNTHYH